MSQTRIERNKKEYRVMGKIHEKLEENIFGILDMEVAKLKEEKDSAEKLEEDIEIKKRTFIHLTEIYGKK